MMKELLEVLRAKSKGEKNYLLKDHIRETIKQVKELREFIKDNKNAIQYPELKSDNFFKHLIMVSFLHDLGKINYKFQKDVFKKGDDGWKKIKEFFSGYWNIDVKDHEIISILYSLIFLGNEKNEKKIRTAILLHHYNEFYVNRDTNIRCIIDDYPDIEKYIEFLIEKKTQIKNLLESLIDGLIEEFEKETFIMNVLIELKGRMEIEKLVDLKESIKRGYGLSTKIKFYEINNDNPDYDFFVFLGSLRRCDYAASGNINIEKVRNLAKTTYEELLHNIKKSIKKENEKIWQEKILNEKDSENLILVAPTGSGKTEFALLWAKNRNKKLIYTLPLRVALNDLYWRFRENDLSRNKIRYFNDEYLSILHSTAFMEHLKEEKDGEEIKIGEKMASSRLFSFPVLLTTPDQIFLSSLKYYGFDKLLSIYPISVIVIDEIQAYNPEMAAVIIKTLEIVKELYGNILIITATFPPYFREFLINSRYTKLNFEFLDLCEMIKSKRIKEGEIKNYKLKRHKIKLLSNSLFGYRKNNQGKYNLILNEEAFDQIKKIINNQKDKNIMIIVNNVGKAIKLYQKIEENCEKLDLEKKNLYLLHSRLIEKEKDW